MKIAIFGTGVVGQTVGGRLAELGNEVTFGTRDPSATLARTGIDRSGNPEFGVWARQHPGVGVATFADAAAASDLVVNATNGHGSVSALAAAGEENLGTKVIVDISNPLDFAQGFPPNLFVKDTDSLAEQIQREFPRTRVVKTLNTLTANLMVDPGQLAGGDHTVLVSGDDAEAKRVVTDILRSFGWTDVLDLGDLSTARGAEMYVGLWVRLLPATGGTAQFNLKVVR